VRIAFLGDVVVDDQMAACLRRSGGGRRLWGPTDDADVVVFNLEAPIAETGARPVTDRPIGLRSAPDVAEWLDARMIACLANNHMMDFGEPGLRRTLETLGGRPMAFAGAAGDVRAALAPAVVMLDGERLAVISAADPRYSPATDRSPGTAPARAAMLRNALRQARAECERLVLVLHMGMEYCHLPTPYMLRCAEIGAREGCDVIQFHHAHCLSGASVIGRTMVLWGTGNYAFARRRGPALRRWSEGAVWLVDLPRAGPVPGLTTRPFALDGDGLPVPLEGAGADRIRDQVRRLSGRIDRPRLLPAWRLLSLVDSQYLRAAMWNYRHILRRNGWRRLLRTVWGTLGTQFHAAR
jgi:poly-gamma-glutamate synthesis protein (capsule biosynthesis protein)